MVRQQRQNLILLPVNPLTLGVNPSEGLEIFNEGKRNILRSSNSPSTLTALHHWLLIVLLLVETLAESAVVALHPGLTAGSAQRPSL